MLWKDEWLPPSIKSPVFIGKEDVASPLTSEVEVWHGVNGYYVYFRYHNGQLVMSSGPHTLESTARRRAKAEALALMVPPPIPLAKK
jgi:hypothetical protein